MAAPEVDKFGELVVTNLRDSALNFFEGLASRHWKSHESLQAALAKMTPKQLEIIRQCVTASLDYGIHHFLFALGVAYDAKLGIEVMVDGKNVAELRTRALLTYRKAVLKS